MDRQESVQTAIENYLHGRNRSAHEANCVRRQTNPGKCNPATCKAKGSPASRLSAHADAARRFKILVAVDRELHPALDAAVALGGPLRAEVAILFVVDNALGFAVDATTPVARTIQEQCDDGNHMLEAIRGALPSGVQASVCLREGNPATEIVAAADEWGADLIVIGTHHRGAFARFFLGSVSQAVLRHARTPVLLVSEGAADAVRVSQPMAVTVNR